MSSISIKRLTRFLFEGIHHIALRVADIEEAIQDARAKGLRVLDGAGRPGARGSKIAFIHPKSTGGILFHFVERQDGE